MITKQPGTGGAVTVGTVTAQLLYEIAEPAYVNPDVVAHFDTVRARTGRATTGCASAACAAEPPPDTLKVAINLAGGYRNSMTMVLTGLDVERKAARAEALLFEILGGQGPVRRGRRRAGALRPRRRRRRTRQATAQLRVTVKDPDPRRSAGGSPNAVIELLLASYAGFFTSTPPTSETAFGVYWPALGAGERGRARGRAARRHAAW